MLGTAEYERDEKEEIGVYSSFTKLNISRKAFYVLSRIVDGFFSLFSSLQKFYRGRLSNPNRQSHCLPIRCSFLRTVFLIEKIDTLTRLIL